MTANLAPHNSQTPLPGVALLFLSPIGPRRVLRQSFQILYSPAKAKSLHRTVVVIYLRFIYKLAGKLVFLWVALVVVLVGRGCEGRKLVEDKKGGEVMKKPEWFFDGFPWWGAGGGGGGGRGGGGAAAAG